MEKKRKLQANVTNHTQDPCLAENILQARIFLFLLDRFFARNVPLKDTPPRTFTISILLLVSIAYILSSPCINAPHKFAREALLHLIDMYTQSHSQISKDSRISFRLHSAQENKLGNLIHTAENWIIKLIVYILRFHCCSCPPKKAQQSFTVPCVLVS